MENSFDYNNFDKIVVTTKREKAENIIKDYAVFGWQKKEVSDDEVFYDVIHITFSRPHVIKNKDELLYLQVCYEEKLNKTADLERYKNLNSSILYCIVLTFCVLTLILGIVNLVKFSNILLGILFIVGCFLVGGTVVLVNKLRKKENGIYNRKFNCLLKDINDILNKVKVLSGVKDER